MTNEKQTNIGALVRELSEGVHTALSRNRPYEVLTLLENTPGDVKKDGLYAAVAAYIACDIDILSEKHAYVTAKPLQEQLLAYAKRQCAYLQETPN